MSDNNQAPVQNPVPKQTVIQETLRSYKLEKLSQAEAWEELDTWSELAQEDKIKIAGVYGGIVPVAYLVIHYDEFDEYGPRFAPSLRWLKLLLSTLNLTSVYHVNCVRPGAGQIEMVIAKESSLVDEFVNILEQRASLEHSARREPTIALYRLEGYPQSFIDQVSLEKNFTLYESERSELTQTNSRVLFYPLQLSKAQAATELNAKGKAFQDATHKYLPQTAKKIQQKFERQKHHKDWK